MSKSSTPNFNKAFQSNNKVNKAQQLRQQKQKKVEDNNRNVSKQLEKSADSWQNSMDQIRRIAKKSHDSSQIYDNVFTDNDDRSELDNAMPQNPELNHGLSSYHEPPPRPLNRHSINPSYHYNDFHRPLSMYANSMNSYYPPRTLSSIDYDTSSYYPSSYQIPLNVNGNNIHSYAPTPVGPRFYNPPMPVTPNRPPWIPPLPPSNFNSSNSMINPYHQNMFPNPYLPRMPTPNYYGYNMIPQYPPVIPHQQPTIVNNTNDTNNSMESMKKYVTTLLDKLEALNETVVKLKNENLIRKNPHSLSHCCNHEFCNSANSHYPLINQPHHYQSIPSNLNHRFSCNCPEQQNCHNRSQSSLSYNHRMFHNHNNYPPSPRSHNNLHLNHNNCHSMMNNHPPRQHYRSYSSSHCPTTQYRKPDRNYLPPLRSMNSSNPISECTNIHIQSHPPPPPSLNPGSKLPNTNNSSQVASIENLDIASSHFDELPVTPIDVMPV